MDPMENSRSSMREVTFFQWARQLDQAFYNWPAILLTTALFVLWQIGANAGLISQTSFSAPLAILDIFWKLGSSGELWKHLSVSLYRILSGFLLGASLGLVTGLLTGWFSSVHRTLAPLLSTLYGFPKIALLPLMIIALGTGDKMRIVLIAVVTFFPMWINTDSGMRDVDDLLIRVAKNFGARERQIITKVALPYIVPYVIAGLKYSAGLALHLIVIAEMVNANSGVGYLVWFSGTTFNVPQLFTGIFTLIILSAALLGLFNVIERRVAPWRLGMGEG